MAKPTFTVRGFKIPEAAQAFTALGDAPGDTLLPSAPQAAQLKAVPALAPAETGSAASESDSATPLEALTPAPTLAAVREPAAPRATPDTLPGLPRGARGRREEPRVKGPPVVQKTFYLPPELAKRLALHCAERGCELSAVAVEALTQYLKA